MVELATLYLPAAGLVAGAGLRQANKRAVLNTATQPRLKTFNYSGIRIVGLICRRHVVHARCDRTSIYRR